MTAGRKDPEHALFPYYTDDKITESTDHTGSKTIFQIHQDGVVHIWEPFSERYSDRFQISRNLYKNVLGNKIIFEEINHDLNLVFSYQWNSGGWYGFVRKCALVNLSAGKCQVKILDGIQNVLPYGVDSYLQMATSNLADAYKRTELHKKSGLGIFGLSAIIVDKAEPSEALKANIAWSLGFDNPGHLLSSLQLNHFRKGKEIENEYDVKGEKGAYFISADVSLAGNAEKRWMIVANVNQNYAQVLEICDAIQKLPDLEERVQQDIDHGSRNLLQLVAGADGLQCTADQLQDSRHYSNVLFNIMRGGVFKSNYEIEGKDFLPYLEKANHRVYHQHKQTIEGLGPVFSQSGLEKCALGLKDPDLTRLSVEYLPLHFSRRHGDPSRPWNIFSINTLDESDGTRILDYEGNWRDIFQNWEALVHSYPGFIEGMIFKFLNATTFDGYNPYRITKGGFDWEIIEPDNPWSYIGYWGDHQIIYLLKFLEFLDQHQPDKINQLFSDEVFVYANVPYRIKPYREILADAKNTVDFDLDEDRSVRRNVAQKGADGALLMNAMHDIHRVNFLEKILATLLAKISNYIPEGGIWMNTQRPEWNDANNALVGNGVSMVTLYYTRRFLVFLHDVLVRAHIKQVEVSQELLHYATKVVKVLEENRHLLSATIDDGDRKRITDALGEAGSDYRESIYQHGFHGKKAALELSGIENLCNTVLDHFEHTIRANRRKDHLYHAYNTLSVSGHGFSISHLSEMLEGQVAAISSGYLDSDEVLKVLDALRSSSLYRKDQNSYLLYPDKDLPGFLQKNIIPEASVAKSVLFQKLLQDNNLRIINRDIEGGYHFNGNFRNANDLKSALNALSGTKYNNLAESERALILDIYEEVFQHRSFTGRSGTFFAYEGLGSIYWHMVSKLHLAVQEACIKAFSAKEAEGLTSRLVKHYFEIGRGIGVHKSPESYGAFPTDPYSHTPSNRGAQQPGMTGQVKEDILVRFGELGVFVKDGRLHFNPCLLRSDEFLKQEKRFGYINMNNEADQFGLEKGSLGFTYCQIPVVYQMADQDKVEVRLKDNRSIIFDSLALDYKTSQMIFGRSGSIQRIVVSIPESRLQ
ncbi:MAG: hypothetical protein R6V49_08720 [Bacteroidales bacterium]